MARKQQQPIPQNRYNAPKQEPDHVWDTVRGLGLSAINLGMAPSQLTPFLRNEELMNRVEDRARLNSLVSALARDAAEYTTRLQTISVKHTARSGSSSDPNDLMAALSAGEDYVNWCMEFEGVIMPQMVDVIEILIDAGDDDRKAQLNGVLDSVTASKNAIMNAPLSGEDA